MQLTFVFNGMKNQKRNNHIKKFVDRYTNGQNGVILGALNEYLSKRYVERILFAPENPSK